MVVVIALIAVLLVVLFVSVQGLFFIWLERKVAGRIQDRLGPTRVGGRFGWMQTIADGVKLIQKEDLIPGEADAVLFRLAPYIVMIGSFAAYLVLPFSDGWAPQILDNALFLILAILSLEVVGVILAGYASGSKWSLLGGMREAAQVVSYEIPMAICAVIPVMVTGTLNLSIIANQQRGWFINWNIFHPLLFVTSIVYFTCATASCKRAPFDLAEAESELVAGFHTEYSGIRWSFFFLSEYAAMFAVSGIFTILFLGGWHGPIPIWDVWRLLGVGQEPGTTVHGVIWFIGNCLGVVNFIIKAVLMVFLMMWARWTLPRLRIDQVMTTCLKYLLPISCALLLLTAVYELLLPGGILSSIGMGALVNTGGLPLRGM